MEIAGDGRQARRVEDANGAAAADEAVIGEPGEAAGVGLCPHPENARGKLFLQAADWTTMLPIRKKPRNVLRLIFIEMLLFDTEDTEETEEPSLLL